MDTLSDSDTCLILIYTQLHESKPARYFTPSLIYTLVFKHTTHSSRTVTLSKDAACAAPPRLTSIKGPCPRFGVCLFRNQRLSIFVIRVKEVIVEVFAARRKTLHLKAL